MKELLYIPNGSYVKFSPNGTDQLSLEEYVKYRGSTIEDILTKIFEEWFNDIFYSRNELPNFEHLSREQFEVIDT